MKTYWLKKRNIRTPDIKKLIPIQTSIEPIIKSAKMVREKSAASDDRSTYSPVTFNEVAKRSNTSSPIKINARGYKKI